MDRKKYINEQLKKHYNEFKKAFPHLTLFALCLQGSQNYGLDIYTNDYKSDVDTKAIVIPSLKDIAMNKEPISITHVTPDNEHIDIKDIRIMFQMYKKQNINFIETLFTEFTIVNPDFITEWNELISYREDIAHYNTNQALRCMAGMSMEKRKALCHPYPSLLDKIEKYGYDGKQLHHILRMNSFLYAYATDKPYSKCLVYLPNKEDLMKAKLNQYSLEEAIQLADFFDNDTHDLEKMFLKPKDEINKVALDILNKIQYEVIKKHIRQEVL